ncbi:MAG: hypothetical protein ACP5L1_01010 [Caldivirga sp.]|uniref:hypothetical protein n=1 Tax=Caldivirga sp. TaxID=2080243 RepID=UPI003D14BBE2
MRYEEYVICINIHATTLIRLAFSERRDYSVLFIDYVGSYERYSDYYGPYPLNPQFLTP